MYFMLLYWWLSLNPSFYQSVEISPLLIFHVSLLMSGGQTGPDIASPAWLLLPKPALWDKKGWVKVHTHGSKGTTGRKCFSCCLISDCWLEVTCWATRGFTPLVPSRGHFISCINIWGHLFSVSFLLYTTTSGVKWLQVKHSIFNLDVCGSVPVSSFLVVFVSS